MLDLKVIVSLVVFLAAVASSSVDADEVVHMNNGMTCFRNPSGFTFGCSGGAPTGDAGFNDVITGERYESVGPGLNLNTRTGQTFSVPVDPSQEVDSAPNQNNENSSD
jgi:hypothetical protein